MRLALFALLVACFTLPAWDAVRADPGFEAERVSNARAIDDGYGAVTISIRSEIYLDEPLQVFFLREGGSIANDADVVGFRRNQCFFAFCKDAV